MATFSNLSPRNANIYELEQVPLTHGTSSAQSADYVVNIGTQDQDEIYDKASYPSLRYRKTGADQQRTRHRHKDGLGRVEELEVSQMLAKNYFIRPEDARLMPFRTQDCHKLQSKAPWPIQITDWVYRSRILVEDDNEDRKGTSSSSGSVAARLLPGALALVFVMIIPRPLAGEIRNGGRFDPIRYREWLGTKLSRNSYESVGTQSDPHRTKVNTGEDGIMKRDFGPKYLCIVKDNPAAGEEPYQRRRVEDYMRETNSVYMPQFVFVSYTRLHFPVNSRTEVDGRALSGREQTEEKQRTERNRHMLAAGWGCKAAKDAGLKAFWIDFECIVPDEAAGETVREMSDVYRICDVVRVAHLMVIIRATTLATTGQHVNKSQSLQAWGSRIWTVPEILLSPPNKPVTIYTQGESETELISKQSLAQAAWGDFGNMRQLLDHYEGSLHLTPLELVSIALEGLMSRVADMIDTSTGMVQESMQREVSHSLMGLLRRRPLVGPADESGFEAFARLSLANDTDSLLERLLCFQPASMADPWYKMEDAWAVKLWDIEPHCQVSGVVDNRTVTLDGAFGATIQWNDLAHVAFIKRTTWAGIIMDALIQTLSFWFLVGIAILGGGAALAAVSSEYSGYYSSYSMSNPTTDIFYGIGGTLLGLGFILALAMPRIILARYGGKFWTTQAWFFGIKGVPDLGRVEHCIFGFNFGRLKWSPAGSVLSRHMYNEYGECIALPPQPDVSSGLELYTIVDTFTMTATAYYAEKPPSVVLICGREGGMQRAVLCSYDWKTQTFCRESVVRMKTLVLERMSRTDRLRFCLTRRGRHEE